MRECELPGRGSESLRFIVVSALLIVTHVNSVCHERCNLNGQCISNGTYPNGICVCNNISPTIAMARTRMEFACATTFRRVTILDGVCVAIYNRI